MKIIRRQLRKLIESFIAGEDGVLHVPEKDPYEDDEIIHPSVRKKFSKETLEDPEDANLALTLSTSLSDKDPNRDIEYTPDEYYSMQRARKDPQKEYERRGSGNRYEKIIVSSDLKPSKYEVIGSGSPSRKQIRYGISAHAVILSSTYKDAEAVRDLMISKGYHVANAQYNAHDISYGIYRTNSFKNPDYNPDKTFAISVMRKKK